MVWLGEKRAQRVLHRGYLLKVHLASRSRASCRPRAMKLSQAGARHGVSLAASSPAAAAAGPRAPPGTRILVKPTQTQQPACAAQMGTAGRSSRQAGKDFLLRVSSWLTIFAR